jgi:hypothetical protein
MSAAAYDRADANVRVKQLRGSWFRETRVGPATPDKELGVGGCVWTSV